MTESTLCQTVASCIACCMNSYLSIPKLELEDILRRRAHVLSESSGPFDYQQRLQTEEQNAPFCKFIGYLDSSENRVGCIIHTDHAKSSYDLRADSRVGRPICAKYAYKASNSFNQAGGRAKEKFIQSVSGMDWYLLSVLIRRSNRSKS